MARSPTRTCARSRAATLISAHTVDRSEIVKTLASSLTASPSAMCAMKLSGFAATIRMVSLFTVVVRNRSEKFGRPIPLE